MQKEIRQKEQGFQRQEAVLKQEIEQLHSRIAEYEEREQNQRKLFDKLVSAFEQNSHCDSQQLIDVANAQLATQLLSTPRHDVEELSQRLAKTESSLEKANMKVQQLKLKKQTVQGDLD